MVTGHKDKKGDFHPHTSSSGGVSENDMKITVKGNNDVISLGPRRKLTPAESQLEYMKTFQNNIEFATKFSDKMEDVSIRGDIPLLALEYLNTSTKNHKWKELHEAGMTIARKQGKNWKLIVNGKIVKTSNDMDSIYKDYENYKTMSFKNTEKIPTPSGTFLRYVMKYPNTKISQSVRKYGYGNYIGEAGGFARALAKGDLQEALAKADPENERILKEIMNTPWSNISD